jgi:hypothetical protein
MSAGVKQAGNGSQKTAGMVIAYLSLQASRAGLFFGFGCHR